MLTDDEIKEINITERLFAALHSPSGLTIRVHPSVKTQGEKPTSLSIQYESIKSIITCRSLNNFKEILSSFEEQARHDKTIHFTLVEPGITVNGYSEFLSFKRDLEKLCNPQEKSFEPHL